MLHVSIYCQLAWYLNTVSIFGKHRVWNLTIVGTSSYMLLGLMCSWYYAVAYDKVLFYKMTVLAYKSVKKFLCCIHTAICTYSV